LDGLAFWATIGTVQNGEKDFSVFGCIATDEGITFERSYSDILRLDPEFAERAVFHRGDERFSEGRDFVDAEVVWSCSVNRPSTGASEIFENSGVRLYEIWIEDSGELKFWSCWIQKRADDVKYAGTAALCQELAHRHDGAKGGMAGRGEEKAATGFFQGPGSCFGWEIDSDAEGLQDISSAGFRGDAAVPVFHDFGSRSGRHEHGCR
jgi:hypothetical protein